MIYNYNVFIATTANNIYSVVQIAIVTIISNPQY